MALISQSIISGADTDAEAAVFDFIELASDYKKVRLNLYKKSIGHEHLGAFASKMLERLIMMSIMICLSS